MFGLIDMCIPLKVNNLQNTALHCINPLFLMVVICLLICVSRRWHLFTSNNGAINVICIVLYLVFISLTQTSLSVLTPVRYPGISQVYVSLEPSVQYFDPKRHLPYALVALLIQLVLVVPFLSLLLFAPCLIRIKAINLTRLKPILDEYQACYKVQCRSFAGYYLTCRQLIFLISLLNLPVTSDIYILQILSILLLTIHCLVQPYKSLQLNILDGLLILDLVLLSILHGNTANVVFDDAVYLQTILVYILVLLPVLYFISVCCLHFGQSTLLKDRKLQNCFKKNKQLRMTTREQPIDIREDDSEGLLAREPLLFLSDISQYDSVNLAAPLSGAGMSTGIVQEPKHDTVIEVTY